ncbi:MAG: hypothetical protein CMH46_04070 [Muricauda sp.]|nr:MULTISPECIES: hypothetical protein [unclassified Allomuricauda]MAU14698.1 hypothetical protein [Allomuricauda sp.]|tara:strand:- start:36310 stop:36759 length:450 start_codon:yes stop_codon:yes gene_type:complete
MKPLFVLIFTFVISLLILKYTAQRLDYQLAGRIGMASMLVFTAIGHFLFMEGMSAMIPSFIPFKKELVVFTGIIEMVFAIALLYSKHQTLVAWLLIAFFVLVLPANIKAAIHHIDYQTGHQDGPGVSYLWFRVPLQLFFIVWVFFASRR